MRIPKAAPRLDDLMPWSKGGVADFIGIANSVREVTYRGKYVHWDKLQHLPKPDNLTLKELWTGLKFCRRNSSKQIPLLGINGLPFTFCVPDQVLAMLHSIDQNASGNIKMPDPIVNSGTKDRYILNSLIEEAITSSQLEGAATTRRVARDMIRSGRPPVDRDERMILNNFRTMRRIVEIKDETLSMEVILDIHRMITEGTLDEPAESGRLREPGEDDIKVYDEKGQILHSPPRAADLPKRIKAMCRFANKEKEKGFLHPVLHAIILHFWLAYEHPFTDGNGRTARALFYWSTLRQGYWLCEFISISQIMRNAPTKYGLAFLHTETDENDLTYFVVYHLEVIQRAIQELHDYIGRKSEELHELEKRSRKFLSLNPRQKALVSHALRHPHSAYTFESHRKSHGVVRQTARKDLLALVDDGYLTMRKIGRAQHFFPAKNLEQLLLA